MCWFANGVRREFIGDNVFLGTTDSLITATCVTNVSVYEINARVF